MRSKRTKGSIIIVVAVYFQTAGAYSSGAPTSVCTSMNPSGSGMTSATAQASQSPFILNVSLTSMNAGQTLEGLLHFIHASGYFRKIQIFHFKIFHFKCQIL